MSNLPQKSHKLCLLHKTKTTQVRAQLKKYKEATYIDIRMFFLSKDDEWLPTQKGVSIPLTRLDKFETLMEKAREIAEEEGYPLNEEEAQDE